VSAPAPTSAPFVTTLRTRGATIYIAPEGGAAITIRVEMPEVWDVVRVVASPTQPVIEVKNTALHALHPESAADEMVVKLHGWEILDETASLADCGVVDGSILLMTFRRRRPVR
jgi:hypothetical protein